MANDLATLNGFLDTALREDTVDSVWTSAEKNNLIDWAVASLWPRYARTLLPSVATIALVSNTYHYALPSGTRNVVRVDLVDASGNEIGPVHSRAWELEGDVVAGAGYLRVSPIYVDAHSLGSLNLTGYGVYDTATNLIPDLYVPLILAKSRAEAYRRLGANREQFKVWLSRNQTQNVSVNELLQLINEADAEVRRLESVIPRVWQKPAPGRQG